MSSRSQFRLTTPQVSFSPLPAAQSDEELLLHQAALEWSLADPIIIESAADVKSSVRWQDRISPFHHQMQNLMTFCRRLPVTLIADDVGLGKTISAGLVLSELMVRRRVNRVLVLCPSILCPQWVEELESKFGIFGRHAVGSHLTAELRRETPVVVTTYESGSQRLDSIEPGTFDMLILDEAHKLRNLYGTKQPPKMAQRVHRALEQRLFKYVLMLTATPIQNRLWDMYTLVDCLAVARGHTNPLGDPREFQRRYIADGATARELRPEKKEEFRAVLRQYLVRTRRDQVLLSFPQRAVRLIQVRPSQQEERMQALVAEHIEGLPGFQQSSLLQAMMSSPAALLDQLRNMAQRRPQFEVLASEVQNLQAAGFEPSKLRGLLGIVDDLRRLKPADWRMVVFTTRTETQRTIGEALTRRGIKVAYIRGGDPQRNFQAVKQFTASPPEAHVIVSTDAGAEGVNLQAGNVVVNYDLPWNPMVVEQRIGRVQRLASKFRNVVIFNLAVAGSPEARVVARLMQKLQTVSDTVGDIEAILEANDGDDTGSSFEATIRKLVVKSLVGQDVERAAAQAEESIRQAKELFDEQRHELDAKLGDLQEGHVEGPTMPKLAKVTPRMPYPEFVRQALTAEGAAVEQAGDHRLLARRRGQPDEEIILDEASWQRQRTTGVFMGRSAKLYVPGKPAFERLVERWVNRSAQRILHLSGTTGPFLDQAIGRWLEKIPGATLVKATTNPGARQFQGELVCKVVANNANDSYEKLVTIRHAPLGTAPILEAVRAEATWMDDELDPEECLPNIEQAVTGAVDSDGDIRQFIHFYSARLDAEFSRAGNDPTRQRKIISDLQPVTHAQVLSAQGALIESHSVDLEVAVDGIDGYRVQFEIVPATGVLSDKNSWDACFESNRRVPAGWLEICSITQKPVLRHLLATSEVSGRKGLSRLMERCEVSGKWVMPDEFATSDVSGRKAAITEFVRSATSGRRGLASEVAECEFTQAKILKDEVRRSDISGKLYRTDEEAISAALGGRGHRSEFVTCSSTGQSLLPQECVTSDIDGLPVRIDIAVRSEKEPFRIGKPEDFALCELTGRRLAKDELGCCSVTGRSVDRDHLVPSDESGRLAIAEAMVQCAVTGKRILPDEAETSAVSGKILARSAAVYSPISGKPAAPEELVLCELTGAKVLPDELLTSDVSGRRFRADEAAESQFSGRKGHRSEATGCEFTGKQLLRDEVAQSDISGMRTAASRLLESEKSGRRGYPSEMTRCAISGKRLAEDEVGTCAVTSKIVDRDLLAPSQRSGKLALATELVSCEESGILLLPSETARCCVTGRQVDLRLLGRSEVSGIAALKSQLVRCATSQQVALPSELVRCHVSGELLLPKYIGQCTVSGQLAGRDRLAASAVSGRLMLPQRAVVSIVDGRVCCPDEAVLCHWNEGYVLPSQAQVCRRTQLTFMSNLLDASGEFMGLKRVLQRQVQPVSFDHLLPALRERDERFAKASRAWGIVSPKGGVAVACVELSEYLGIRVRYAGLLMLTKDSQVLGQATVQVSGGRGWQPL